MNISAFSIRNPLPAIVMFVVLSIAGVWGFSQMSAKLFPDIDVPIISVIVPVPGASPQQLENEVARKVEDKVAQLRLLKHVRSSLHDNVAKVLVEFAIEKNPQEALDEVRSAVNEVKGDFPSGAEAPLVTEFDLSEIPLFIYSISSSHLDPVDLSWFVDNTINKELLGLPGVASVDRIGGVEREIQVLLDNTFLQVNQLPVAQVSSQVRNMQQDFSGGDVLLGGLKQPIRTKAAVKDARALNAISIALPNGSITPLGSIADIRDTYKTPESKALLNGSEGVAFVVKRSKGYGDLEVGQKVRAAFAKLKAENPELQLDEVFESVSKVQEDYSGAMTMLVEGAFLAVFVVLLFLGGRKPTVWFALSLAVAYSLIYFVDARWSIYAAIIIGCIPVVLFFNQFRTTLVAAVALPLSILPAFAAMHLLGISMNMMVTLALSLVIGILVDDAIVEVENIDRHIGMKKSPYQASIDAADEIGMAVIAITTTLIAVFLPTAFMPGIPGKFFYQFGMAASLAIFSSLLVARIVTPMMCAYFLKPHQHKVEEPLWMPMYLRFAKLAIRFRWLTMAAAVVFFVVSLIVMGRLPKDFIPPSDGSFTQVLIELPPGQELDETLRVAESARTSIQDMDSIKRIFSYVGGHSDRTATLFVTLTKRGTRPFKRDVENEIRQRLKNVSGARLSVMSGGNGEKYEMILTSSDTKALQQAADAIARDLRTVEGLGTIANDAGLMREELIITPDYAQAAKHGVSSAAIAHAIRIATVGDFDSALPKLDVGERQIPIVVRLPDTDRKDFARLENLLVIGSKGAVRIGDVATLSLSSGPLLIKRYDRNRYVQFDIEIKSGGLGEIQNAINNLSAVKNLPASVKQVVSGDAEVMGELAKSFVIAMGAAVLCIYFVLILLFGQLSQPITILAALPLSVGGAVLGLILVNSGMSLASMIGFLMLMGIAVKNSILLVEYIIDMRTKYPEIPRIDAIMDACHKRARPIIMTTIAMGAGMLPLILGLGEADSSFRRPMAAAVFGGLITSTFLSLVVIPALYSIVDDARHAPSKIKWYVTQFIAKLVSRE